MYKVYKLKFSYISIIFFFFNNKLLHKNYIFKISIFNLEYKK
jgi:hypothetical protein